MSDGKSPAREERVPAFIYLDMDRVKSISSRMDEGYIEERIKEDEEMDAVAASLSGSIRAYLMGLGSGSVTSTVEGQSESTSVTGETKALHHYYFPLLEEWLEEFENDWFHDVNSIVGDIEGDYVERAARSSVTSAVSEGDIIRVKGDVELLNFSTSLQFIEGMLDAIDRIDETLKKSNEEDEQQSSAVQSDVMREGLLEDDSDDDSNFDGVTAADIFGVGEDDLEAIEVMMELFHEIMPKQYEEMIAARIRPFAEESSLWFWALVQSDNLDTDPVELLSKYEASEIPDCTVVARVETVTEEPEEDEDDNGDEDGDIEFGTFHHIADAIASDFGFKVSYPAISISPIAIYR